MLEIIGNGLLGLVVIIAKAAFFIFLLFCIVLVIGIFLYSVLYYVIGVEIAVPIETVIKFFERKKN